MWQVSQGRTLANILPDGRESSGDEEHFMGEIATIGELSEDDYTIELSLNN